MDNDVYETEYSVREFHWWFVGRKRLFGHLLKKLAIDLDSAILDIGVSTGSNLALLKELGFSNFIGIDCNEKAIQCCAQQGFHCVKKGDICQLPMEDNCMDLIIATDIIEHVENDELGLSEMYRVLKPGGITLMTAPAFMSLWGLQDEVSHHYRRYRLSELIKKAEKKGFIIQQKFYFNYILFAAIWLARRIIKLLNIKVKSENEINTHRLNKLLTLIFKLDVITAPLIKIPFGASACMVMRKSV